MAAGVVAEKKRFRRNHEHWVVGTLLSYLHIEKKIDVYIYICESEVINWVWSLMFSDYVRVVMIRFSVSRAAG